MQFKIVFMGTSEFSVPALEALIKNKLNVLVSYTQPAKKSKRGQKINPSPIEKFCKNNGIKFRVPVNLNQEEELNFFKTMCPDIVVVVSYGKIIPKSFLSIPKFGFINIHASILPKWRGAAPIQRAIINRDKKLGITIMKIEEKLDSGPVLYSQELELLQNKTHGEIAKQLSEMGANLLIKSLKVIENDQAVFTEQIHSESTYAKKINKSETKINWNLDADKVLAHIHGLSPTPGAWFEYKSERYKILKAKLSMKIGKPSYAVDENLTIACKSNSIQVLEIQRQGRNKQTSKEFLLGKKIRNGSILN
jgi:methionyl-tRNA formyltransferase